MNLLLLRLVRVPSVVFERREIIALSVFGKAVMNRSSSGLKVEGLRSGGGTSLERRKNAEWMRLLRNIA